MKSLKNKLGMRILIFAVIVTMCFWLLPANLIMGEDGSAVTTDTTVIEATATETTATETTAAETIIEPSVTTSVETSAPGSTSEDTADTPQME